MTSNSLELEQQLKLMVDAAQTDLEQADVLELWAALEPPLASLPRIERLRIAGLLISELAEVYWAKASQILDDWEEGNNTAGPIPTDVLLDGIRVRQTQYVNVEELVRSQFRFPRTRRTPQPNSTAQPVDKSKILAMMEMEEEAAIEPLAVAHAEDVSSWQRAIAQYLTQTQIQSISLVQLQQALGMPLVEVWLGLLLGGFTLEQHGDFYDQQSIWLTATDS